METKRKLEEAERKRQEEEDLRAAVALQAQLEKEIAEDSKYRQQLEQERRDHELAMRLAQESNSQVDDGPLLSRYVSFYTTHTHTRAKYFTMPKPFSRVLNVQHICLPVCLLVRYAKKWNKLKENRILYAYLCIFAPAILCVMVRRTNGTYMPHKYVSENIRASISVAADRRAAVCLCLKYQKWNN